MTNRTLEELRAWVDRTPGAILEEDVPPHPLDPSHVGHAVHAVLVGSQLLLVEAPPWTEPGIYTVGEDRSLYRNETRLPDSVPLLNEGLVGWLEYLDLDACVTAIVGLNSYSKVFRNRAWYSPPFRVAVASELGDLLDDWFRGRSAYDKTHENEAIRKDVRAAAARLPADAPLASYRERMGEDPGEVREQLTALHAARPQELPSRWRKPLRWVRRDGRRRSL